MNTPQQNHHNLIQSALFLSVMMIAMAVTGAELHVSPTGDDANPGTAEKPLATLERARDVVRAARAGKPYAEATAQSRIVIHAGTYRMARPLTLTPDDSNLAIEAAPGEQVRVSGGRVVTGWQKGATKVLKADLSKLGLADLNFRELYSNGERQQWARVPNFDHANPRRGGFMANNGMVEPETKTKLRYAEGALSPARWTQPDRGVLVLHDAKNYRQIWSPLKSVDTMTRVLEGAMKADYFLAGNSPFYVCGMLEELDTSGEWCVDHAAKTLHYWPAEGKEQHEVVVPALESLIVFQGDAKAGRFVKNVCLAGLALSDCRKESILMKGAERCQVIACDLRNVGTGVWLGDDTHACRVAGCDITQTLRDGVTVMGTSLDHDRVSGHEIDNNYIWNFGWGDFSLRCGGVFLNRCSRIRVTHNHIHDGPRYAIGTDTGEDFEIAWNRAHHVNLITSDSGIIEGGTAWDWQMPDDEELRRNREHNWGNRIHHNLVYDSGGWSADGGAWRFPDYTWAIYLDLCNSGWHVHDNIAYDTVWGGFMQNAGEAGLVENNVFVGGKRSQLRFNNWTGYAMLGHRAERNIIAYSGRYASLLEGTRVSPKECAYDRNLVHCESGRPFIKGVLLAETETDTWKLWQAAGQDKNSLLADPMFVDAARRDYRLKEDSPALRLGIRSIDLSAAGNYASAERRTWPRPEEPVVRPPADYREATELYGQPALRHYEDYATGERERAAYANRHAPGNRVTDEAALSGRKSLRFEQVTPTNGSAMSHPFLTYPCEVRSGRLTVGFALRIEEGVSLTCEWRNTPGKYQVGPRLVVDARRKLVAGGKTLMELPAQEWVRFDAECPLGSANRGTYQLTISPVRGTKQVFTDLKHDAQFTGVDTVVIQLGGNKAGGCWIDDLMFKLEPYPELATTCDAAKKWGLALETGK